MRRVGAIGLLVSTASAARAAERLEHGRDAVVGARVIQQPLVVEGEVALERVGRTRDAARLERARDERAPRRRRPCAPMRSSGSGAAPHDTSSALAASAMSRRESTACRRDRRRSGENVDSRGSADVSDLRRTSELRSLSACTRRTTSASPRRSRARRAGRARRPCRRSASRCARRSGCCRAGTPARRAACSGATSGSSCRSSIL